MSIKITGLSDLAGALNDLTRSTERAVLKRTATSALTLFVMRAQQLVPVHEGHLRDSIVIGGPGNLTRGAKSVERAEPKGGVRVYAGSASRNAVPREFGSERSRAQPFMRPAWLASADEMLAEIQWSLGNEIDLAAQRAAKKASKKK